jgi:hypothetical protein
MSKTSSRVNIGTERHSTQHQNNYVPLAEATLATTTFAGAAYGSYYAYGELPEAIEAVTTYSGVGASLEIPIIGRAAAAADVGAMSMVGASVGAASGVVLLVPLGAGFAIGSTISSWVNSHLIDPIYGY